MFYSVGANRAQLLNVYFTEGGWKGVGGGGGGFYCGGSGEGKVYIFEGRGLLDGRGEGFRVPPDPDLEVTVLWSLPERMIRGSPYHTKVVLRWPLGLALPR